MSVNFRKPNSAYKGSTGALKSAKQIMRIAAFCRAEIRLTYRETG